jgi:hypothetical protein
MIDTGVAAGLPAIVAAQSVTPPAAPAGRSPEQLAQAAQIQAAQAQAGQAAQQ